MKVYRCSCGAPLDPRANTIYCEYCGTPWCFEMGELAHLKKKPERKKESETLDRTELVKRLREAELLSTEQGRKYLWGKGGSEEHDPDRIKTKTQVIEE